MYGKKWTGFFLTAAVLLSGCTRTSSEYNMDDFMNCLGRPRSEVYAKLGVEEADLEEPVKDGRNGMEMLKEPKSFEGMETTLRFSIDGDGNLKQIDCLYQHGKDSDIEPGDVELWASRINDNFEKTHVDTKEMKTAGDFVPEEKLRKEPEDFSEDLLWQQQYFLEEFQGDVSGYLFTYAYDQSGNASVFSVQAVQSSPGKAFEKR